jgi:hypothetical protein
MARLRALRLLHLSWGAEAPAWRASWLQTCRRWSRSRCGRLARPAGGPLRLGLAPRLAALPAASRAVAAARSPRPAPVPAACTAATPRPPAWGRRLVQVGVFWRGMGARPPAYFCGVAPALAQQAGPASASATAGAAHAACNMTLALDAVLAVLWPGRVVPHMHMLTCISTSPPGLPRSQPLGGCCCEGCVHCRVTKASNWCRGGDGLSRRVCKRCAECRARGVLPAIIFGCLMRGPGEGHVKEWRGAGIIEGIVCKRGLFELRGLLWL